MGLCHAALWHDTRLLAHGGADGARDDGGDGTVDDCGPRSAADVRAALAAGYRAGGRQFGLAQDYWLAAERHVLSQLRAMAAIEAVPDAPAWLRELVGLPPQAYLDRIRVLAFESWQGSGNAFGNALDHWLKAEETVLGAFAALARGIEAGQAEARAATMKARVSVLS